MAKKKTSKRTKAAGKRTAAAGKRSKAAGKHTASSRPAAKRASAKRASARKRPASAAKAVEAAKKTARPKAVKSKESAAERKARALRILKALKKLYPQAECALRHNSAYELLTATILSAQCTDERVNMVTPNLFRKYPNAAALADGSQEDLEALIRSTGFFRNKAKSLLGMARKVRDEFGGEIPDLMDELLTLPGVARKTANCVLGTWFGHNVGVVVDTHVGRLALRLRLLSAAKDDKDAVKIERDLMELFPADDWTFLAHALIDHGRAICNARKPKCGECKLAGDCPSEAVEEAT